MDRVLIVIDNVQFNTHLENTFRKVGYITETLLNDYSLSEKILSFNPDVIVSKGTTSRLSVLKVGKKIKDNIKYTGKVVLVFPAGEKPTDEQMETLKVDLVLEDPASALKIVVAAMSLEKTDRTAAKEKLYSLAHEDKQYQQEEQAYLKQYGGSIENELIHVQSLAGDVSKAVDLTEIKSKIQQELQFSQMQLPSQIEHYNELISNIDADLNKGLKKRDTKRVSKELRKDKNIGQEASDQDELRKQFVNELFRKK
jgi:chemotaxis response regulator CheB